MTTRSPLVRGLAAALVASIAACTGLPGLPLGKAPEPLRVGTSGDYAPFSFRDETGALTGFDVELARRFAAATDRRLELVPFVWPDLLVDLEAGRFDVALSGVTVRPDRSLAGRFTVPVAHSGAVVLLRDGDVPEAEGTRARVDALDRGGFVIAVNQGGHLERVTRGRFERAVVLAIPRNDAVPEQLLSGRANAVVTDTAESPHWIAEAARRGVSLVALGPITHDDKAGLLRPDREALAHELDAWLLARERDGTLATLRARHLGRANAAPTATPAAALDAARRERLALMPLVAEAKRATGGPVEDVAREQKVLASALAGVERAAKARGVDPPPREAVEAYFRQQIEDAKSVQRRVLASPRTSDAPTADLATQIRPALLRIGDRIAQLLVEQAVQDD